MLHASVSYLCMTNTMLYIHRSYVSLLTVMGQSRCHSRDVVLPLMA